METKTIHALLLSFVMVAGAVTINDAFAQSNTDRLIHVVETTDNSNNMLMAIQAALDSISAQVMSLVDAVAGVAASVSGVSDQVSAVQSGVDSVGMGVSGVSDSVSAIGMEVSSIQSSVDHVDEHVGEVKMAVDGLGASLTSIQESVGSANMAIDENTSLLKEKTDNYDMVLQELQTTVGRISDGINNNQNEQLALRINSLEESVNNRLAQIETTMSAVSDELNIVTDVVDRTQATLPTVEENTISDTLSLLDYASGYVSAPDDNLYKLNYELSCTSSVFVNSVKVSVPKSLSVTDYIIGEGDNRSKVGPSKLNNPFTTALVGADHASAVDSTIYIDGTPIVDTKFDVSPGVTSYYHRDGMFDLKELRAGDTLNIVTVMDASYISNQTTGTASFNHTIITGSNDTETKGNNAKLYDIMVDVISVGDPGCSFSLPDRVSPDYAPETTTIVNALGEGTGILKSYDVTVSCNDQPAQIRDVTKIKVEFATDPGDNFVDLTTLTLSAGGKSIPVKISGSSANVMLDAAERTLKWDSGDLQLTGSIPLTQGLLIKIPYHTTAGNSCEQQ